MNDIKRVGIVGLGKMGNPMARHLAAKGFETRGYDVSAAACAAAEARGIVAVASPRELAAWSDFVIVVVGFDSEVEQAMLGDNGIAAGAHRDLAVGIASTIAPSTMRRLGARLEGSGLALLDMPLTRGEWAAEAAQLLVMAGGDEQVFARCRPAIACFADAIYHLGALGSGQVGKMVNNLILWACISANHEGLMLGDRLGVDRETLRAALLDSSAGNWALKTRPEEAPMPWAEKDMRIVLAEADHLRVSVPLCGVVKEVVKTVKFAHGWPTPEERDG
jgi:3-hydroxyisobutyrate dehydrogenase-like beta-hydroxyacid dehydrogenase